uniref:Uncharacterized protein n=1 Tax=Anguilla anguilla TaxID=7936 RepID=A0A0E9XGK3_ANGAN
MLLVLRFLFLCPKDAQKMVQQYNTRGNSKEAITACNKQMQRSEQEYPCIKRQHDHRHESKED